MVISRKKDNFATRLKLDNKTVDRQTEIRHLGVWLREDMSWEKNISEICKKAYSRVKMLSKLKYVGTKKKDLILLYCLHIRSITEYCSTAFHSSLTLKQANKLESIQKTCLRIILCEDYISYESALISTNLLSLKQRREKKEISFALKCTKHPTNSNLFPLNFTMINIISLNKSSIIRLNTTALSSILVRHVSCPGADRLVKCPSYFPGSFFLLGVLNSILKY